MKVDTEYFGCLKIGAVTVKSRVTLTRDTSHVTLNRDVTVTMSDSGLSLASSSGPVSGDNDRDQAGDYHGGQPGDGGHYRGQAGDPRPCPRLSHGPGLHLSKSVANLHSSASASDQESVSLSR